MANGTSLEQTKGKIKLVGRVEGLGNENSYKEGFTKNDSQYLSLQFFLNTSDINRTRVELFGMEKEHVYAYSQKERKSKKIEWAKRKGNHGDYKVMGVGCYLETDPKNSSKKIRAILPEFDAVDYIKDNLKDGDVVRINGEIDFQEYVNQQGVTVNSKKFIIKSITKLDEELDFGADDFEEESTFEQDIVINDVIMDEEANRLHVSAKIIKYGGDVLDTSFTVDTEKYPKLAGNMTKRFGFGDKIKVYGLIINTTIKKESDEEIELVDDDDWGGDDDIKKDYNNDYINEYIQELQIISVESSTYEPKKYSVEDLVSVDENAFNGQVESNKDLLNDDEFDDEDGMDELPFE